MTTTTTAPPAEISIDWGIRRIYVPQAYLEHVTGTLFELDTEVFREDLLLLSESEEGMPFPDTHQHYTEVTVAGVTYARFIIIINMYEIEFEDGQYSVRLAGSNNNFFDVENDILVQNQVQVIPGNAAGLIKVIVGGVEAPTVSEIADEVWAHSGAVALAGEIARALGLMQENYYLDQTVYTSYNGLPLLTSGRIRLYSVAGSVGTSNNVVATYQITATWTDDELDTYKVVKQ
jgi:hypothetical protein